MQKLIIFILFLFLVSCGGKDTTESAIFQADYYLTSGDCTKAKKVLDDAGWSNEARYIGAYSNVYACFAGFSELEALFDGNLDLLQTSTKEDIFKSFASFSTSNETAPDSDVYENMDLGIHTILNSVGTEPSAEARNLYYQLRQATDLNSQALYMLIFQFGKFLALYGNTNTDGEKGNGARDNTCFMNYTNGDALAVLGVGATGVCTGGGQGGATPLIDFVGNVATATRRACEGIIYFNNLLDILRHIDLSGSDMTSELDNIVSTIDNYTATLSGDPDLDPYLYFTSQSDCEDEVSSNQDGIEKYYASIFEVLLQ